MPDIEKIINVLQKALNLIFNDRVPPWALRGLGYVLLTGLLLLGIWGLLIVLSKIKKLWRDEFKPLFYDPDEKRRSLRRRRFADHLESEIRRLNNLEAWSDYRFAELEAEVEAEGKRRALGFLPILPLTRSGLRRERSLSKALALSRDRLIVLEGDPGAGKSVALRYVTQRLATRARRIRNTKSIIPIFINLKELERPIEQTIDKNLIHSFVLRSLNRINDRDIEQFLEEEFDRGLRDGTWLFLFDSFDELPEVLSSTEADMVVNKYTDAISSFLHGLNQCRGVIASRHFRGPGPTSWPRFRILPLSENRRRELIKKADISTEHDFIGRLANASLGIRSMAGNPMFLSLLCEHVRSGNAFPQNAHEVFETYIHTRLSRDTTRLEKRFAVSTTQVRAVAESVSFCMAAEHGLGLSPSRANLIEAMTRQKVALEIDFDVVLDALEYIKLARSEIRVKPGESRTFTFAHRRFQEYFATSVVLREPTRISANDLLTNARWRETAVVMFQSQPMSFLSPLMNEARHLLRQLANELLPLARWNPQGGKDSNPESPNPHFQWPVGAIHLLSLLQDGLGGRLDELQDDIRHDAGEVVLLATKYGTLYDRKWALEIAGIIPNALLLKVLRSAFRGTSQWLKDTAYRQTARLGEVPLDIASAIRMALVDLALSRRLTRERHATKAHLARLGKSSNFLSVLTMLLWIPIIDIALLVVGSLVLARGSSPDQLNGFRSVVVLSYCALASYLIWTIPSLVSHFARSSLFMIGLLRTYSLFPLYWLISDKLVGRTPNARSYFFACLFISLICVLWAPLAWNQAQKGTFIRPLSWPIIPLLGVVLFPGYLKRIISTFVKMGGRNLVLLFALCACLILSVRVSEILFFAIVGTVLGLAVLLALVAGGFWLWDLWRWFAWVRHPQPITGPDFLRLVLTYQINSHRLRFIRTVKDRELLAPNEQTEMILGDLSSAVERDLNLLVERYNKRSSEGAKERSDHIQSAFVPIFNSPEFNSIYSSHIQQRLKLGAWGSETLDVLNILLERIRTRRIDSTP